MLKLLPQKTDSFPLQPTRIAYDLLEAYEQDLVNIFLATTDLSWQA